MRGDRYFEALGHLIRPVYRLATAWFEFIAGPLRFIARGQLRFVRPRRGFNGTAINTGGAINSSNLDNASNLDYDSPNGGGFRGGLVRQLHAVRRRLAAITLTPATLVGAALLALLVVAPASGDLFTDPADNPLISAAAAPAPDGRGDAQVASRGEVRDANGAGQDGTTGDASKDAAPANADTDADRKSDHQDGKGKGDDGKKSEDKHDSDKPRPVAWLDQDQMDNAAIIVHTGEKRGLPKRAYVIAVATALQESKLLNLANPTVPPSLASRSQGMGYDHDSIGLFQQRPSSGWGAPEQLLDPEYAAGAFYGVLVQVPGWENLPLTMAAQSVQVSAFPWAYAQHEGLAQQIVDTIVDHQH